VFLLNSFELPLLKRLVIFGGRIPLSRENKETEIVDQVEEFESTRPLGSFLKFQNIMRMMRIGPFIYLN